LIFELFYGIETPARGKMNFQHILDFKVRKNSFFRIEEKKE